jgi:hypothetical protein
VRLKARSQAPQRLEELVDPTGNAELLRGYAAVGVGHVVVWPDPWMAAGIVALAPVLELLDRGLRPRCDLLISGPAWSETNLRRNTTRALFMRRW